jgi:hypothetical protein
MAALLCHACDVAMSTCHDDILTFESEWQTEEDMAKFALNALASRSCNLWVAVRTRIINSLHAT